MQGRYNDKKSIKSKKYLKNFDRVEHLMQNVKLRDEMRAFQSPVTGEVIMKTFNLEPGKKVGDIKKEIENAILDGKIPNEFEAAFDFMMKMEII